MDIEQLWQNSSGSDDMLNKLLEHGKFDKIQTNLPLRKLRRNLLIGIIWAVVITLLYISLLFFFQIWQAYVTLAVLIFFNTTILVDSWKLYKKTPATITPSNSLKEELTTHSSSFQKWWSLQQRISFFVYPIACSGGFMIGGMLGSGKSVEEFLYNPRMFGIMGISVLLLVPACYFGAKWMFNVAYGKHLRQLRKTIDELE